MGPDHWNYVIACSPCHSCTCPRMHQRHRTLISLSLAVVCTQRGRTLNVKNWNCDCEPRRQRFQTMQEAFLVLLKRLLYFLHTWFKWFILTKLCGEHICIQEVKICGRSTGRQHSGGQNAVQLHWFIFFVPSLLQWEFVYSSSLCFLLVVLEIQYVYVSTTGMCWGWVSVTPHFQRSASRAVPLFTNP